MNHAPVTFLLTAYNQAQFIEAAVSSALTQTYSPLTIIISDDCSTDDTFAVIGRAVAAYSGPHRVVVRKNEANIAIGHVRDLLPLVETEFVVLGHGDDVFEPRRVEMQIGRMIEKSLGATACNATIIDAQDRAGGLYFDPRSAQPSLEEVTRRGRNKAQLGAILAWRMELFHDFPPPDPPTRRIDQIVSFRALLMRGLEIMPEPLVRWRHHGGNRSPAIQLSSAMEEARKLQIAERKAWSRIGHVHFMLNDLVWWMKMHPADPRSVEFNKAIENLTRRLLQESKEWAALRYRMAREKAAEH
jgi:glycosyltransferase involved in cell wall biosynthesis